MALSFQPYLVEQQSEVPACVDCKSDEHVTEKEGHYVCMECGVVGPRVLEDQEWRSLDDKPDASRVGSIHDLEQELEHFMSTAISYTPGDHGKGPGLVRSLQQGFLSSTDRAMLDRRGEVSRICTRLHLPAWVVNTSQQILQRVYESRKIRAKGGIEAMAPACIFAAIQDCHHDTSLEQVCHHADAQEKEVRRIYRRITKEGLHRKPQTLEQRNRARDMKSAHAIKKANNMHHAQSRTQTQGHIKRLVLVFQLSAATENCALHICRKLGDVCISTNRQPNTVAAACIIMACKANLTEQNNRDINLTRLVEHTCLGASTIRSAFRELYVYRQKLVPDGYTTVEALAAMPSLLR